VDELADHLGALETAVLAGLELLAAKGLLAYREEEGRLLLAQASSPGPQNQDQLAELLAEAGAYRRYFSAARPDELLRVDLTAG
jgi:hypothetical protein